tara:strand:- start:787 stop:1056 length:270 start_codon:yes stop_codon:yes gene_type:complete
MSKPDKVWFAVVNLGGGLLTRNPRRASLEQAEQYGDGWWSKCGNYSVKKLGLDDRNGCITFASEDKKLVRAFCDGANALRTILREFTLA